MNNEADSIRSAAEEKSGLRSDPNLPFTCVPCKEILLLLLSAEYRHQSRFGWPGAQSHWVLGDIQTLRQKHKCIICRMVLGILLPESEISSPEENCVISNTEQVCFSLGIFMPYQTRTNNDGFRVLIYDHHNRIVGYIVVLKDVEADCPLGYSSICENRIDPKLYSRWIQNCTTEHREEQSYVTDNAQQSKKTLDLIAIDVVDECLVKINTNHQYVALSYVWGGVQGLQLLVSNRTELETPGRLSLDNSSGEIPSGIMSAMILVKQMEKRYLWVDRFCIEQDNQAQKHFNVSHMDLIYSQALVTLLDLSSPNATEPIPGILNKLRIPVINRWTFEYKSKRSSETVRTSLRTCPTNLQHTLLRSEYEKRAWTFQERLLSPRCLYFTSHMAYYRCVHGKFYCDADDLLLEQDWIGSANAADTYLNKQLYPLQLSPLEWKESSRTWQPILAEYAALVDGYSQRKLSFAEDKLNAFAGILAALMRSLPGSTVGGLPESLIDFCLLWTDVPSHGCSIERNHNFPSWSWASSNLPTTYYYGPLYIHEFTAIWFRKAECRPNQSLVSKLEELGTSFETSIRPMTRINLLTEHIQPESYLRTTLGKDVLHFNAEVCSIQHFRISQGAQRSVHAKIQTYPEGNVCGLLYPCSWTRNSTSFKRTNDKFDFVLLSAIKCPLCKVSRQEIYVQQLLQVFSTRDYCSQTNCTLRHVMLIEWHGDRQWAERVGIATIQGNAWDRCKRRRMRITLK